MFLLDSNACIRILTGSSRSLVARLRATPPSQLRLCSVVKAELLYGARHSRRVAENLRNLEAFFAPFVCLPFDDRCAEQYGMIRADLARSGSPIGPNDLLIAAIARAHDLILVTADGVDFSPVVGLRIENWEAG